MKKKINVKPVTKTELDIAFNTFTNLVFKKEVQRLDGEIAIIKMTMATKQDIKMVMDKMDAGFGLMLDRFDFYNGKQKVMDQEQLVQGLHIKELREASLGHENRITALEKSRSL